MEKVHFFRLKLVRKSKRLDVQIFTGFHINTEPIEIL